MEIHPIVVMIIWIIFLASFIPPIISLIRHFIKKRNEQNEIWSELEEKIRKLKDDLQNRRVKQSH